LLPQNNTRLTYNNFDLLRLLFASAVCLDHSYKLSGYSELHFWFLSSSMAVNAFFVLSGFLIFMSYERSRSLSSYASKRIRRIYPAYFTVVMLCAIGLALASSKSITDYFSLAWLKYVFANLTFMNFIQPTLPGVFESYEMPSVNGALWTIKIEAMFYLSVPFFVFLFRRFGTLLTLIATYCLSFAYKSILIMAATKTDSNIYMELSRQLPGQLSYFMAGAFFYYFLHLFERKVIYFMTAAITILSVDLIFPLPLLEPFAVATLVIFFGLYLYTGNFGKYGDFSYGIYILHFPIIQVLVYAGWFKDQPWYFFMSVIFFTTIGAFFMWHLVEKHFLYRRNHYMETQNIKPL
jgi:peptidoglycan/LPS O-acetylase OafA/YrhL